MIIRIVKMTFKKELVKDFLRNFDENKQKIRQFKGCQYLELWQEDGKENVFCTHSHWETAKDLENYRHSAFFESVWNYTKTLFEEKAIAFSVQSKEVVKPEFLNYN
ncbi:MAG: antibiotic biosynthesis monooxygenase [Cytophagia bacterium]|nr:MAG: antibiotic biosynthesis monooxygenase [Cytophagia bacterium]TAG42772.1 MAG: antibiotic biosynthesis monooxygenase [Cytophagia bacterium]